MPCVLYDGFGMVVSRTGTTPTPFGFVGKGQYQTDNDSGLQLLGHRYYDASVGRFISSDPAKAGDNWYAYCDNNPLKMIDPDGLLGFILPGNPGGLPPGWTPIPHGHPGGGARWKSPSGQDGLEFHPGRPGERGYQAHDHWHKLLPRPNKPGSWDKQDAHLRPGQEVDLQPVPRPADPYANTPILCDPLYPCPDCANPFKNTDWVAVGKWIAAGAGLIGAGIELLRGDYGPAQRLAGAH